MMAFASRLLAVSHVPSYTGSKQWEDSKLVGFEREGVDAGSFWPLSQNLKTEKYK